MKKILLIEGDQEMRQLTAEVLRLANYQVFDAENGKDGVEIALRENPDLIISDVELPVLDGFGVLHLLQKIPQFVTTPLILLSGNSDRKAARRAMELGADDCLSKPVSETELLHAIESRLQRAERIMKECNKRYSKDPLLPERPLQDVLKQFLEGRNINRYNKKQIIYSEKQHPSKLFYILTGKVRLYKCTDEGKELTIELNGPGDFLGYRALLQGTTYQETAETLDTTELAVIPMTDFEQLLREDERILRKFTKMLATSVCEKESRLVHLAYNSLRKKVAEALIYLRRTYPPAAEKSFSINLNRDDLAHIAGTATESLIRTLTEFKSEKLIAIAKDGKITLLNEKKLEQLAD